MIISHNAFLAASPLTYCGREEQELLGMFYICLSQNEMELPADGAHAPESVFFCDKTMTFLGKSWFDRDPFATEGRAERFCCRAVFSG